MRTAMQRRESEMRAVGAPPARNGRAGRWYRRGGRLAKMPQRNAQWAAEARHTPPLHALGDAA